MRRVQSRPDQMQGKAKSMITDRCIDLSKHKVGDWFLTREGIKIRLEAITFKANNKAIFSDGILRYADGRYSCSVDNDLDIIKAI